MSRENEYYKIEDLKAFIETCPGNNWAITFTYVNKFKPDDIDITIVKSNLTFKEAHNICRLLKIKSIIPKSYDILVDRVMNDEDLSRENAEKVFNNTHIGVAQIVEMDR